MVRLLPEGRCRILLKTLKKNKPNTFCLPGSEKSAPTELIKRNADIAHIQSYLVPTPFVVANHSVCSVPRSKPVGLTDKTVQFKSKFTPKVTKPAEEHNQKPSARPVPLEVNVVIPPSAKPREHLAKTAESSLPLRGPLSYDALVHLRRNASKKKTPLCPTIDHTIDSNKHCSAPAEGPNVGNRSKSVKFHLEDHKSKTGPPAVAPKPKKIPADIAMKFQNEGGVPQDDSDGVNHAANPQVVRQEALQKLGLLRDQEPPSGKSPPPSPPKPHSSSNQKDPRFASSSSTCNPARNFSFTSSQEHKNRNLQKSVDSHPSCRNNQETVSASHHPSESSRLKGSGLDPSASQHYHTNSASYPEPIPKPRKTTAAPPSPEKPSDLVGYTVMVVPGMGSDRKEALRKLGLLKN